MKCRTCSWCEFDPENPAKVGLCRNPVRKEDPYVSLKGDKNCSCYGGMEE